MEAVDSRRRSKLGMVSNGTIDENQRLLGMLLIIVGLYSFLWGRRNESRSMPPPKVAGEVAITGPESATLQVTAVVMPTDSPDESVIHVEEEVDRNHSEALEE